MCVYARARAARELFACTYVLYVCRLVFWCWCPSVSSSCRCARVTFSSKCVRAARYYNWHFRLPPLLLLAFDPSLWLYIVLTNFVPAVYWTTGWEIMCFDVRHRWPYSSAYVISIRMVCYQLFFLFLFCVVSTVSCKIELGGEQYAANSKRAIIFFLRPLPPSFQVRVQQNLSRHVIIVIHC